MCGTVAGRGGGISLFGCGRCVDEEEAEGERRCRARGKCGRLLDFLLSVLGFGGRGASSSDGRRFERAKKLRRRPQLLSLLFRAAAIVALVTRRRESWHGRSPYRTRRVREMGVAEAHSRAAHGRMSTSGESACLGESYSLMVCANRRTLREDRVNGQRRWAWTGAMRQLLGRLPAQCIGDNASNMRRDAAWRDSRERDLERSNNRWSDKADWKRIRCRSRVSQGTFKDRRRQVLDRN